MKINKTIEESIKLEEKYSESTPKWLKAALDIAQVMNQNKGSGARVKDPVGKAIQTQEKSGTYMQIQPTYKGRGDHLNIRGIMDAYGIDPSTIEYHRVEVPKKGSDPILNDPDKVLFFFVHDDDTLQEQVYVKDPNGFGDELISIIPSKWGSYKYLPYNTLRDNTKDLVYVELTPDMKKQAADKKAERQQNKTDSDAAYLAGNERRPNWFNPFQKIDKSGYIVDPRRYTKRLAELGYKNYQVKIDDLHQDLMDLKNDLIDAIEEADMTSDEAKSMIRLINYYLTDAARAYRDLVKVVKSAEDRFGNGQDEEEFKKLIVQIMNPNNKFGEYKYALDKYNDARKAINKYLSAVADWDDEYSDADFWS